MADAMKNHLHKRVTQPMTQKEQMPETHKIYKCKQPG